MNHNTNFKGIITFLGVIMLFFSRNNSNNKVAIYEYEGKFPDESAKDIELVMSDSGVVSFTIFAPRMNKYEGDSAYMDFPEGITIVSYSNGERQSILTADYAISVEKNGRMEAHRNVVITDLQKQESIKTEEIIWDKALKKIYSNVSVRQIKADGSINTGDGFEADERFTKYVVFRPRAEVLVEDL